ncbi:MAG: hypothetical protein V1809_05335 [Planctomycetota bacterium]
MGTPNRSFDEFVRCYSRYEAENWLNTMTPDCQDAFVGSVAWDYAVHGCKASPGNRSKDEEHFCQDHGLDLIEYSIKPKDLREHFTGIGKKVKKPVEFLQRMMDNRKCFIERKVTYIKGKIFYTTNGIPDVNHWSEKQNLLPRMKVTIHNYRQIKQNDLTADGVFEYRGFDGKVENGKINFVKVSDGWLVNDWDMIFIASPFVGIDKNGIPYLGPSQEEYRAYLSGVLNRTTDPE